MKRCPAEGRQRFALGVGAAVLANHPMKGVRNKLPIRLGEESRLSSCLIGIAKVAKPNAHQAKALLWTQLNTLP